MTPQEVTVPAARVHAEGVHIRASEAVLSGRTEGVRTNRMAYLLRKAETEVDMDLHVLDCRSEGTATVQAVFKVEASIQGSEQESVRRAEVSLGKAVVQDSIGTQFML